NKPYGRQHSSGTSCFPCITRIRFSPDSVRERNDQAATAEDHSADRVKPRVSEKLFRKRRRARKAAPRACGGQTGVSRQGAGAGPAEKQAQTKAIARVKVRSGPRAAS